MRARVASLLGGVLLWVSLATAREDTWEKHDAAGNAAFLEGRFVEAEKHFKAAVKAAQKLGPANERLVSSLDNLVSAQLNQGNLRGARDTLKRSLAIQEKLLGPNHLLLLRYLDRLSNLSELAGDNQRAFQYSKQALDIRERQLGLDHPAVADNLERLADLLFLEKALENVVRSIGSSHESTWTPPSFPTPRQGHRTPKPHDLGVSPPEVRANPAASTRTYQADRKTIQRALPWLARALVIRQGTSNPGDTDLLLRQLRLGFLYLDVGKQSEALNLASEILAGLKANPQQPPEVLNSSALFLRKSGRVAEASEIEQLASSKLKPD